MLRMNIVNFLIGELSGDKGVVSWEAGNKDVIDNLVENWERKKYLLPRMPKNDEKIIFDNSHVR